MTVRVASIATTATARSAAKAFERSVGRGGVDVLLIRLLILNLAMICFAGRRLGEECMRTALAVEFDHMEAFGGRESAGQAEAVGTSR